VPLAVSSQRYDFRNGDTLPSTVGRRRHVVIAQLDFVTLWARLAWFQDRGLDGDKQLRAAILPLGEGPWGLLVIRGERSDRVLIVSPTLATQGRRILSAVNTLPSPVGVGIEKPNVGEVPGWVFALEDRLRPLFWFYTHTLLPPNPGSS
jgi:hypothetical protein